MQQAHEELVLNLYFVFCLVCIFVILCVICCYMQLKSAISYSFELESTCTYKCLGAQTNMISEASEIGMSMLLLPGTLLSDPCNQHIPQVAKL